MGISERKNSTYWFHVLWVQLPMAAAHNPSKKSKLNREEAQCPQMAKISDPILNIVLVGFLIKLQNKMCLQLCN